MTKCLDSPASEILTPFMCQASQFIPANTDIEIFTSKPGAWNSDHIRNLRVSLTPMKTQHCENKANI